MGSEAIRAIVLSSLYPNRMQPGFGNFVHERVRRLATLAAVVVVAPVRFRLGRAPTVAGEDVMDGIRVLHPRYAVVPRVCKWSDGFLFAIGVLPVFRRAVREFSPDIVDAHWGYPDGFAAYLLARLHGLPVVITVRGSDINVFLRERLRGYLLKYCLRHADHIIAVSSALKQSMVDRGIAADSISVVRNGVDTEQLFPQDRISARQELGLPTEGKVVVCIGNIVPIKGQDLLLKAFREIAKHGEYLVFVGDGEMRRALARQVGEFPPWLAESIRFVGRQPHEEIPRWIAAADLLCLPSRNEGLPNVVLEALACGRPVVATRVGGVEEVVTSTEVGRTVPPEDVGALGQALREVLDEKWDAELIRRAAERFSWGDTIRQCFDVWNAVIARRNEGKGK